jgi:hypothetical protein
MTWLDGSGTIAITEVEEMDKEGLINYCWERFKSEAIHPEASEEAVISMRRCFYAGASAVIGSMVSVSENNQADKEIWIAILGSMKAEADRFAIGIKIGIN